MPLFLFQKGEAMHINVVRLEAVKDKTVEYGTRQIKSPEDLAKLGFRLIGNADREVFYTVCLSTRNTINAVHLVSVGSLTASVVHPREVYKLAVINNSASVAFLHNHPSGNSAPSNEDIQVTRQLIEAGKVLGIRVLDHVIVGDETSYSLSENNDCDFTQEV
jgi:DNA repair protein RadC